MPTGYTADVADGKVTDFRTFALRCARQFGACIMQRDDPANDPPKPREISDYTLKRVAECEAKLATLHAMTLAEAEDAAARAYGEEVKRIREAEQRDLEIGNRYDAMLAQVTAWEPPTPEHVGLKEFMAEQLRESIKWDTGYQRDIPPRLSGAMWLAKQKEEAARSLTYALESLEKETRAVEGANAWIAALYNSLGEPASV